MDWLPWFAGFCFCCVASFYNLQTAFQYANLGWKLTWGFYTASLSFVCGGWFCFYEFVQILLVRG